MFTLMVTNPWTMYKNQYIISMRQLENQALDFKLTRFDDAHIYSHPSLSVFTAQYEGVRLALLGYVLDPFSPEDDNQTIIDKLSKQCSTADDFFRESRKFSGRYVLLYKNDFSYLVTGDACHLRHIYYGVDKDNLVFTSSVKLFLEAFQYELKISDEKLTIVQMPSFLKEEHAWYGDEAYDDRLKKLLPNHYFDVNEKIKKRLPIFQQKFSGEKDIIEFASMILKNTISSLNRRYKILQPLTSGLDSRILLAASRDVKEHIQYYVFGDPQQDVPDVWVPKKLKEKYGLDLKIINPEPLREDFLENFRKEFVFPRILGKTANIQHHYYSGYGQEVININGNCSEITRLTSGFTRRRISLDMVFTFNNYKGKIPYFNNQLEAWYADAQMYAAEFGIPLLDLLYWEQRIGNWHALWQQEQDIAIEECSPFNNLSLIAALCQVVPDERKSPHYLFYPKLISHLWPEILSEPINPGNKGSYIQRVVKGSTTAKYIGRKIKSFLID